MQNKQKSKKSKSIPAIRNFMVRHPTSHPTGPLNSTLVTYHGESPLNEGVLGQGTKRFDVLNNIPIFSTPTIQLVTGVTQGVGVTQRIGDAIKLESLTFWWDCSTQNADIFSGVVIVFFQYLENAIVGPPTAAVLLEYPGNVLSPFNWSNSPIYRVLYQRGLFQSGTASVPTSSGYQGDLGVNIPLNSAKPFVKYAPGSIQGFGNIYLMVYSNSIIAPTPSFDYITRLTFRD
jgi:hypothetical protein